MIEIILLSSLAAFIALDITPVGQFMFSRPIVCGPLFQLPAEFIIDGLDVGLGEHLVDRHAGEQRRQLRDPVAFHEIVSIRRQLAEFFCADVGVGDGAGQSLRRFGEIGESRVDLAGAPRQSDAGSEVVGKGAGTARIRCRIDCHPWRGWRAPTSFRGPRGGSSCRHHRRR